MDKIISQIARFGVVGIVCFGFDYGLMILLIELGGLDYLFSSGISFAAVDGARDYRLMTRPVVDAIFSIGEYNRFSKGIYGWVGFKTKWIPYENVERVSGETKWSFWTLFLYSLEGIIAFSTVPLAIASLMGILLFTAAFIWLLVIVVKTLIWGDPVTGFPTLACILLLVGGSIQLSLDVIGQYLAKNYLETKKRPIYIVGETETSVYGKREAIVPKESNLDID